ncbi:unnamed protein product [Adineta steineri]|uniref:Uncharacterized protein n=1 Tax=Adineta steineri TaxID=433720 RepID=A0A813V9K4_9BILA|nr:unnamed protein product [Adineta steineri]CAF0976906.1 unnamed protein product [Adineta steineri]
MAMILRWICALGLIPYVLSIRCYTCESIGHFCTLPLNIDGGEDHNEYDIPNPRYDAGHVCMSNHYISNKTGVEKVILRGTKHCTELNVINHRIHCCNTSNCNKNLPTMMRKRLVYGINQRLAHSNHQLYLPSIMLMLFAIIFQYYY